MHYQTRQGKKSYSQNILNVFNYQRSYHMLHQQCKWILIVFIFYKYVPIIVMMQKNGITFEQVENPFNPHNRIAISTQFSPILCCIQQLEILKTKKRNENYCDTIKTSVILQLNPLNRKKNL